MVDDEAYLKHYGVLGMKWGVRKDRKSGKNPDYSDNQRKRDRQVYGQGGPRRINRALNKGTNIATARGSEKTRRDKVMGRNKYVRQIGKATGAVAGGVIGFMGTRALGGFAQTPLGAKVVSQIFGDGQVGATAVNLLNNPVSQTFVAAGAAKVANMFAGDLAVSANMRRAGYDPNRK